jgi:hypothetical protein
MIDLDVGNLVLKAVRSGFNASISPPPKLGAQLNQKVGLPTDHWSDNFQVLQCTAITVKAAPKSQ